MSVTKSLWAAVLWTLMGVGIVLCFLLWLYAGRLMPSGNPNRDREMRPRADLMMFYGSALLLRQSPRQLYDENRQGESQKSATGLDISGTDIDFLPYPYPPVVAFAFVPLTVFQYPTAYVLMMLINFLALGISLWLLSSRFNLDQAQNQMLALCTMAPLSVYVVFLQGQVSFFVLLLYVLVITNLRMGRDRAGGLWAGLLAFKPTCLPVWLFWFAIRRRWRALGYALAVNGAIGIASILLVGVDGLMGYLHMSEKMIRGEFHTVLPTDMPTLKAVTYYFGLGNFVWLGACAAVLVALARAAPPTDWEYCAVIIAAILVAPHMHPQELVLLLIIVAIVLAERRVGVPVWTRWSLFAFMLAQSAARVLLSGPRGTHWPVIPLGLLVIFAYFLRVSGRSRLGATQLPAQEIANA